jgi:hypothetical protein
MRMQVSLLLLLGLPVPHAQHSARRMPKFSWETLPVGWHSSNETGVWAQPQVDILARYAIITLEKMQGVDLVVPEATRARKGLYWCQNINNESDLSACLLPGKQAEDQHIAAAKAIKTVNPDAVVISYLNSVIQYPWYGAARTLAAHPGWWLRNASNDVMHNLDSGRPANESWLTYDHTVKEASEAWRDACLSLTRSDDIDACYVDGCTKVPNGIAPDKKQAYGPAKMAMLVDLQKKVAGPLVCGSNGAVYPGMAGSQIQNWGKSKKYSKREIPMLQKAVAAGALFEAHGSAVCHADGDPHDPAIQTELAAFLVAAGQYSYYMCSSWSGTLPVWYHVYDMKIGAPLGNATLGADKVWRRRFLHVNVSYDTVAERGTIGWAGTVDRSAPASLKSDDREAHQLPSQVLPPPGYTCWSGTDISTKCELRRVAKGTPTALALECNASFAQGCRGFNTNGEYEHVSVPRIASCLSCLTTKSIVVVSHRISEEVRSRIVRSKDRRHPRGPRDVLPHGHPHQPAHPCWMWAAPDTTSTSTSTPRPRSAATNTEPGWAWVQLQCYRCTTRLPVCRRPPAVWHSARDATRAA